MLALTCGSAQLLLQSHLLSGPVLQPVHAVQARYIMLHAFQSVYLTVSTGR
jgi:hypothetical protein